MKRSIIISCIYPILYCLIILTTSCAVNPVSGKRELMLISEDGERGLGRQTDKEVVGQYGVYEDADLQNYLDGLCRRLGKLSHRPGLPYQFKILDTPVVNAFAVPGGYVYFTRGILAYLNSEAEMAGVLGHEIGRITARHSAQQLSRAQLAQIGLGVGMVLSETLRDFQELAQFGVGMLFMRFSRDNEREADDLGVEYATKAGYDATHLGSFFQTLERMAPKSARNGLPDWFSTHPNPEDRVKRVTGSAKAWRQRLGLKNPKTNRDAYLKKIDGMVFGEDPRYGYVEDHVFYHPLLRFLFPVPVDWKLENTRKQLRMISRRKDAVITLAITQGRSVSEAAQLFVSKSGSIVIESGRENINGLPARRVTSQIKSSRGVVPVLSYFIKKDQYIYAFHGFSSADRFNHYRPVFQGTIRQFRVLIRSENIRRDPDRLRIRPARARGPLRRVLLSLGVPKKDLEKTAIINGKSLDDPIVAKTLLKVVERGG